MKQPINTFDDFLIAKQELKQAISSSEEELRTHKLVKITSAISEGNVKDSISDTISSLKLKDLLASPLGSLLSTYLLSNKVLRKYFVGFTIARQTIPFALKKLKSILDDIEFEQKKD